MSFDDLLANNRTFAARFPLHHLSGKAAKGIALVTCMDSRIEPLEMVGLTPGDAKILRTPGAHVTSQVLHGLVLARHLLNVDRVLLIQHTNCAMSAASDRVLAEKVHEASGIDVSHLCFGANPDQEATLRRDVELLLSEPAMEGAEIGGFMYSVETGELRQVC